MSKSVLLVEDEMLIALDIETTLAEQGFAVVVAGNIETASSALQSGTFDLAVLDWHLKDGRSAPIAAMLTERSIPFVVCSGSMAPNELAGVPFVAKPFSEEDLVAAIEALFPHKGKAPPAD